MTVVTVEFRPPEPGPFHRRGLVQRPLLRQHHRRTERAHRDGLLFGEQVSERLSDQRIDEIPLADGVHFVYLGDHPLAADLHGADAQRAWLRDELFRRLPGLRFEVEDMIVEGAPWSTRVATRYAAIREVQLVYRGVQFTRIVWGKVVEERILPDTQALAAALA